MKPILLNIFFFSWIAVHLTASPGPLRAYLSYSLFYSPVSGPYIETYLSIMGNTVSFTKNPEGKWQSAVEITMIFRQGDSVQYFDKYNLLSPVLSDSSGSKPNFIDQKRIQLRERNYDFEISVRDVFKEKETSPVLRTPPSAEGDKFLHTEKITVTAPADRVFISDIEFIESVQKTVSENVLSKNGYDMVPYVSNFFPQSLTGMRFYCEMYNGAKFHGEASPLLLNYFIESNETGKKMESYARFKKAEAKDVIPLLSDFAIGKLPSGNYNLVVEVRDKSNNKLCEKKIFFQRSNPAAMSDSLFVTPEEVALSFVSAITNTDTLGEYISCLKPISTTFERENGEQIIKTRDMERMKNFFLSFWLRRNGSDPERAWNYYYAMVLKVNRKYSTHIHKGYETDRGRVYLQYGEPNSITQSEHEPSAYPYEIWHYYKIGNQSNLKFVFVNSDLVSNNYELIHSDMIGEINDPKWHLRIHKRNTPWTDVDEEEKGGHYGGKSQDLFNKPK